MPRPTKDERALRDQITHIDARIAAHNLRIASIQSAIDEALMLRHQLSAEIDRIRSRRAKS